MAFEQKTDYCGLVAATTPSGEGAVSPLVIRDSNLNGSNEKYQPQGGDGSFIATEIYGEDTSPSNTYALKSTLTATAGMISLNKVISVSTKKYALENLTINTGAATEPSFSASCQEVESTAVDSAQCHYEVPAFSVTTKQHAQDIFGAFTLTGGILTACNAVIACTVNKVKVAGTKVASDSNSGVITVSGTVLVTGSGTPTITPTTNSGFVVTKMIAPTEQNPETAYRTFSFELQKPLVKDTAG